MGDGIPPVPVKLAARIRKGEFIDMGELLPKFWSTPRGKVVPQSHRHSYMGTMFFHVRGYPGHPFTNADRGTNGVPGNNSESEPGL